MAEAIITQSRASSPKEPQDWEGHFYREACARAQEEAAAYLAWLDDQLLGQKPAEWRVVGKRPRTVVTRFGEVTIQRRLYRDEQGKGRFLLDEVIGLPVQQAATAEVQETVVALAADLSFGKAAVHLERLTAGVLSKSTVWRLLEAVGQRALEAETQLARAVYEQGHLPPAGKRQTTCLHVEADGVWVRLQREEATWMEIRLGMAYEGWERLSGAQERYRLRNKRVYVHGSRQVSFWEGASVAWWQVWDFARVQQVVLNGDGAGWVSEGRQPFEGVLQQYDGFHLARTCRRALGREAGQALYEALRQGNAVEAHALWANARPKPGKGARRAWRWLAKHLEDPTLMDWRLRAETTAPDERGLGGMEGNISHLIAERMKGKGRSWSRRGALAMAKVQELVANQELSRWCGRGAARPSHPSPHPVPRLARRKPPPDPGDWLQVRLPGIRERIPSDPALLRLRLRTASHLLT